MGEGGGSCNRKAEMQTCLGALFAGGVVGWGGVVWGPFISVLSYICVCVDITFKGVYAGGVARGRGGGNPFGPPHILAGKVIGLKSRLCKFCDI